MAVYDPNAEGGNADQPWSALDVYDLMYQFARSDNIDALSVAIQRNSNEVDAKVRELGLYKMSPEDLWLAVNRARAMLPKTYS